MAREYPKDSTILNLIIQQSSKPNLPMQIWPINVNLMADPYDPYGSETKSLPESAQEESKLDVVDIPVPGSGWSISTAASWNPPDVSDDDQVADPSLIPILFIPEDSGRISVSSEGSSLITQISLGTPTISITGSSSTTTETSPSTLPVTDGSYLTQVEDPDKPDPPVIRPSWASAWYVPHYMDVNFGYQYDPEYESPTTYVRCCGGTAWQYRSWDDATFCQGAEPTLSQQMTCKECEGLEYSVPPCASFIGVEPASFWVTESGGRVNYVVKQIVGNGDSDWCSPCGCFQTAYEYPGMDY